MKRKGKGGNTVDNGKKPAFRLIEGEGKRDGTKSLGKTTQSVFRIIMSMVGKKDGRSMITQEMQDENVRNEMLFSTAMELMDEGEGQEAIRELGEIAIEGLKGKIRKMKADPELHRKIHESMEEMFGGSDLVRDGEKITDDETELKRKIDESKECIRIALDKTADTEDRERAIEKLSNYAGTYTFMLELQENMMIAALERGIE